MMKNTVMGCIGELVNEFPDSPLSIQLIAAACSCTEHDIQPVFEELVAFGFLKKKTHLTHVYHLTEAGIVAVQRHIHSHQQNNSIDN